jgi:hypothetical protein
MAVDPSEPGDGFTEDFVKGAAFTEPSARERARKPGPLKRARVRRAERRAEKRRRRAMVAQWRDPKHRTKGLTKTMGSVLTGALIVAVIAALLWNERGDAPWRRTAPTTGAGVPEAGVPIISADDPFEGSPAATYAVGDAGIEFPRAKAMNGLSADDMALAFVHVKRMVVAANLDPDTVFNRRPDALAELMPPEQRRDLRSSLKSRAPDRDSAFYFTSFAPKTAEQVGSVIKVHGTTKVRKTRQDGMRGVTVELDHIFVYPVRRPGKPDTLMRVVVRRTSEVFVYREPSGVKFWLSASATQAAPVRCDSEDGFLRPVYADEVTGESQPTGAPVDPYDLSRGQGADGCEAVTRT